MSKRSPTSPPALPGYTFVEHVGSGGYADVFLYEQASPSRRVAVKVLDSSAVPGDAGRSMFTAEANLMARVSAHPYIVQVFQSDIAPDGRPYLVMEYYPGPNFYDRARDEQMSVDEVLRVGIQVASAVETAHRAGVLHRDIKPANILTSEYRHPGLTDFGIASAQGPTDEAIDGVSIPWSSPESLGEQAADRRADVYSLAATLYTLLTGRAPFEISGGDNRPLAMMSRIERNPLPSIGRADVPPALERLLARSMAKDPAHRPQTAADLARELQAIESEMRFPVTKLDLAGETPIVVRTRSGGIDDDSTRVKGIIEIQAQGDTAPRSAPPGLIAGIPTGPAQSAPMPAAAPARPRVGMLAEPDVADTVARPVEVAPATVVTDEDARAGRTGVLAAVGAAVLAVVVAAVIVLPKLGGDDVTPATTVPFGAVAGDQAVAEIGPVADVVGEVRADGSVVFTWQADDREPGDSYEVVVIADGAAEPVATTAELSYTMPAPAGAAEVCVDVTAVRVLSPIPDATRGCVTL